METKPEPVGTELSKIIPRWAVNNKKGCSCKDWAKKMDKWGIEGCEARRGPIVQHLVNQSDKLIPAFRAASGLLPVALKRKAAEKLLNLAIKNARKTEK